MEYRLVQAHRHLHHGLWLHIRCDFSTTIYNCQQNISNYCTKETDSLSAGVATSSEYYTFTQSACNTAVHWVLLSTLLSHHCSGVPPYCITPDGKKWGFRRVTAKKNHQRLCPPLVCAALELLPNTQHTALSQQDWTCVEHSSSAARWRAVAEQPVPRQCLPGVAAAAVTRRHRFHPWALCQLGRHAVAPTSSHGIAPTARRDECRALSLRQGRNDLQPGQQQNSRMRPEKWKWLLPLCSPKGRNPRTTDPTAGRADTSRPAEPKARDQLVVKSVGNKLTDARAQRTRADGSGKQPTRTHPAPKRRTSLWAQP